MPVPPPPIYGRPVRTPILTDNARPGFSGRVLALMARCLPALAIIVTSLGVALALGFSLGDGVRIYIQEGGIAETLTVVVYALVALSAIALSVGGNKAAGLVGLLALLMGLREMDAHKAFTTYGVFKTRLYVSPDVSLAEKLIAGLVVVALLVLVVLAIRRAWRTLALGASNAGPTLLALGGFGVFLKEIDGIPRQMRDWGSALDADMLAISKAVEEVGELGLPFLLGLALIQLLRRP